MAIVGLDIGGANLKAAVPLPAIPPRVGEVWTGARTKPFALWKNPGQLAGEIRGLLAGWAYSQLAVTMTGELCDCFADRREGVLHILNSLATVAKPGQVRIWRTDGRFATVEETLADPLPAASANWLALATFAGRFAPIGPAVLIDIGSTTTDIVPLHDGVPVPKGRTDYKRLQHRELLYTGVRRTPVCALLDPGVGMAEFFATTLDVYLTLGQIAEDPMDYDTADGRPATREFARARLARMRGGDVADVDANTITEFAESIARRQRELILSSGAMPTALRGHALPKTCPPKAVGMAPEGSETLIVSGSGSFLLKDLRSIDLSERIGPEASSAACALAVATLLFEHPGDSGP